MSTAYFKHRHLNDFSKASNIFFWQVYRYMQHHPALKRLFLDIKAALFVSILGSLAWSLYITFPALIPYLNEHFEATHSGPVWASILPVIYFTFLLELSLYTFIKFATYLADSLNDKRMGFSYLLYPLTIGLLIAALRMVDWGSMWYSTTHPTHGFFTWGLGYQIALSFFFGMTIGMCIGVSISTIKKRRREYTIGGKH